MIRIIKTYMDESTWGIEHDNCMSKHFMNNFEKGRRGRCPHRPETHGRNDLEETKTSKC